MDVRFVINVVQHCCFNAEVHSLGLAVYLARVRRYGNVLACLR